MSGHFKFCFVLFCCPQLTLNISPYIRNILPLLLIKGHLIQIKILIIHALSHREKKNNKTTESLSLLENINMC